MTQDERYLKEKVASACQQAKWREYRSYPKLLEVLCKLYSKEYLVEHEKEIKGYVDACAKYHGTFDFAAHFSHDLPKGGGGYDSREMIAMPNPPSNGASNSPRPSHDDLAGLNYTHLIKNPEEPPISEKMQCGPQLDFFPQATMSEYTETSPWKPIWAWCPGYKRYIPLICREARSKYSWISERKAQKLEEEIKPSLERYAPSEAFGTESDRVVLVSSGLIEVSYQPYNCLSLVKTTFNVHSDPDGPDMLIGQDAMPKLQKLRRKGLSYDMTPERNATHAPPDTQRPTMFRRRRHGDSSLSSQASHCTGVEKAPAGEPQNVEALGIDTDHFDDSSKMEDVHPMDPKSNYLPKASQKPSASRDTLLRPEEEGRVKPALNLLDQPSRLTPPLSIADIAFNVSSLAVMFSLAWDILFFVGSKIWYPSQEVTFGSGLILLLETCQQLLPSFEITSLFVTAEAAALAAGLISWSKTRLNFFRRHWR